MEDLSSFTDLEVAQILEDAIKEAEVRYPDSTDLQDAHEALNRAARALLSADDAAKVGVYPLTQPKGGQTNESPPVGKGDPPPKP